MKRNSAPRRIIGVDARFYGPLGKGLGRYTQEVVDNVIKITQDQPVDYVIFLSPANFDEFVCPNENVRKELIKARWYSLAEQFEVPYKWRRAKIDLMHFPHFNVPLLKMGPYIVTIHDLILTKFPTVRATTKAPFIYWLKDKAYRLVIRSAIRRAKKVITVSEFTKRDLITQFKTSEDKIAVTYEGVANLTKGGDSLFVAKLDNQSTLELYNIRGPYLLYVGNAYPHKNLEGLVRVFAELRKEHPYLRLVLVGKEDFFYDRVRLYAQHLNLWQKDNHNTPVVFPGYVPDVDLEALFQEAALYVFPSLYEGFGLPPLEAMAYGCPVASSNCASMPEILGGAAAYFDPKNEEEMRTVISNLLNNQVAREELITLGKQHVKKYNWWECARLTAEIYQKVLIKG